MGDISVIARRLSEKHVQYGWSGNGGCFNTVGARLLEWYADPDQVEYLFGLGQLAHLWRPGSEEQVSGLRTQTTGKPHGVGTSERQIFSKIYFVDYGYFYDSDNTWYYVRPGPFRIKIPLTMIAQNLDERSYEFSFVHKVEDLILKEIFSDRYAEYLAAYKYDDDTFQKVLELWKQSDHPMYDLFDKYSRIFKGFDDWVVIHPAENGKDIGEIILKKKEEPHIETIFW